MVLLDIFVVLASGYWWVRSILTTDEWNNASRLNVPQLIAGI